MEYNLPTRTLNWLVLCGLTHKQVYTNARPSRAWDAPKVGRDCQTLLNNATSDIDKARLLAVNAVHGSEWIFVLPISAYGLRISSEAVRIAIGLRLGLNICEPHSCPCGAVVDAEGIHWLSCRRSAWRSIPHSRINDLVRRAQRWADTPSIKEYRILNTECVYWESSGLLPGEDKRPDGLTLVPWQDGLGRHCSRHVGVFLCYRQRSCHWQCSAGGRG